MSEELSTSERIFNAFWADLLMTDGELDMTKLANELADFHFVMEQVPKVYDHITGGVLSKLNYLADVVIGAADDHMAKLMEEALDDIYEQRGPREAIFEEIVQERQRQDDKWGGPDHDDEHDPFDWAKYIVKHAQLTPTFWNKRDDLVRKQMIRVAALAVAAVEACDRRMK